MATPAISRKPRHQRGITLIEVLVSVLLLSFALLGMAALQAQSLAQQTTAVTRGNVPALIADITDRMRSNLSRAPGYSTAPGTATFAITANWAAQATAISNPSTNCLTTVCDAAARETYDLTVWRQMVRRELPRGSALLTGEVRTGVNITLMWFDKDFRSGDTMRTSPTCAAGDGLGARQTCCPAEASVPEGVRCLNTTVVP